MISKIKNYYKRPEYVFLGLALVFGTLSLLITPMYGVPDEVNHFSVAHHFAFGGYNAPKNLWVNVGEPVCIYKNLLESVSNAQINVWTTGKSMAILPYLPQIFGFWVAKIILPTVGGYFFFGRLFNLLFYIVVIFFVIKKVNVGKWVFATIALFPTSLMLAASLSYDAMTYALVFALVAIVFNMFTSDKVTSKHKLFLCLSILWLASYKTNYILLVAPLLFLSPKKFKGNRRKVFFNVDKWVTALGCIVSVFLGMWVMPHNPVVSAQSGGRTTTTFSHFLHVLFNTYVVDFNSSGFHDYADEIIRQPFGIFGSFQYSLPTAFIFILFSVLLFSLLIADNKVRIPKSLIISSLAVFFTELFLVAYIMYFNWGLICLGSGIRNAEGVQGRYFAPMIPLFIPLCAWVSNTKLGVKLKSEYVMPTLVTVTTVLCCGLYILMTWWYYYHLGLKVLF